ncbi:MAG: Arm DNA-binding domain-containing protein [Acetobacter sp.]|uniref:Arm DNA-binding domain-containing protein n=1 Tax=Acetobacter sp. TaxID=440 RepID=UPI0039E7BCDC
MFSCVALRHARNHTSFRIQVGCSFSCRPVVRNYGAMKYCFGGKEKLLSLGAYPEVTLTAAREARDQACRNSD